MGPRAQQWTWIKVCLLRAYCQHSRLWYTVCRMHGSESYFTRRSTIIHPGEWGGREWVSGITVLLMLSHMFLSLPHERESLLNKHFVRYTYHFLHNVSVHNAVTRICTNKSHCPLHYTQWLRSYLAESRKFSLGGICQAWRHHFWYVEIMRKQSYNSLASTTHTVCHLDIKHTVRKKEAS